MYIDAGMGGGSPCLGRISKQQTGHRWGGWRLLKSLMILRDFGGLGTLHGSVSECDIMKRGVGPFEEVGAPDNRLVRTYE